MILKNLTWFPQFDAFDTVTLTEPLVVVCGQVKDIDGVLEFGMFIHKGAVIDSVYAHW